MKVFGVVYLIWNIVNGKKYVGQTVKARFNEHARQNGIIGRAIRKYGKKNFRYGIVKSCAS
ncbi:MAG: GIY-YIG nuclease family protein, partial [Selenomonadaceae bacterium]|nr:GIY-YIG nuclease family protein [Selenomonadaceae bacterium]